MLRIVAPLLLAGLFAAPAAAQEKYTVKIRKDAKGEVIKVTESDTEKGMMKITVGGMTMPKDEDKSMSAAFTEKIIEKETGKRPTKVERTYTAAESTRDGKKTTPSFVGKTVLIERSGANYKFSVDGKELTGDDARFLHEEFKDKKREDDTDIEKVLLPTEPIAVNGTWKPDTATLVKELMKEAGAAITVDEAKSTATGKLLRVYKKDGRQYGVLEIVLTMPLKELGADGQKIAMEAGSTVKVTFGFDGCIDGSTSSGKLTTAMEMKMLGSLKTPDGGEVKLDALMKKNTLKTQDQSK